MKKLIFLLSLFATIAVSGQIQPINVGSTPNDKTGDPARTAFIKVNANDLYLSKPQIALEYIVLPSDSVLGSSGNSPYEIAIGNVIAGTNLVGVEAFSPVPGNKTVTCHVYRKRSGVVSQMTTVGATLSTDATINTVYDDLGKGDLLMVSYSQGAGSTNSTGLYVILTFKTP